MFSRTTAAHVSLPRAQSVPTQLAKPARDAYFDNAKGLLILLVVIGHSLESDLHTTSSDLVYRFNYSFHMPAFVIITGFLSQRFKPSPRAYLRLVTTLLVPYVIFQLLHAGLKTIFEGQAFSVDLLHPAWTMWFLLATAAWRAVIPLLRKIPMILPLSIMISLGAGFLDPLPRILSLDRIVVLLPFFVLGMMITPEHLARIKQRSSQILAWVALAALALITFVLRGEIPLNALYYKDSYAGIGADLSNGLLVRLITFATGPLGALALLAITPRQRHRWTHLGRWSLYIYLLHPLVLYVVQQIGFLHNIDSTPEVIMVTACAAAVTVVLASRPVRKVSELAVEPPLEKLYETSTRS